MFVAPLASLLVLGKALADYNITCYGYDGAGYGNNVICPGSNACCGVGADCLSSRLCHNADDPSDLLVRGPCAVSPWDNSTCSPLCPWDETSDTPSGTFPRVNICSDGSYCCTTFDVDCCAENHTVWLDEKGNILTASPTATVVISTWHAGSVSLSFVGPTSTSSSSSSTSTTSQSSSTTMTSATMASPTPTSRGSGISKSTLRTRNIGIGAGVVIGIVAIATGLGFFMLKRMRRTRQQGHRIPDTPGDDLDDWLPSKPPGFEDEHEMHEMPVDHPELPAGVIAAEILEESTLLRRRDSLRHGPIAELE